MPEVESVSETCASEGERLSGNESQEAVDEIEDHEVDADARTEEVPSFKSVLTEPSCC